MTQMNDKRYAIFDLDGTLLDTLDDLTDSMNYILKENGFPLRTREEIRSFVGNGVRKLVERAIPSEKQGDASFIDRLYKDFSTYYNKNCMNKTDLYEGILELVDTLIANGYDCAVVSNKIDAAVKELSEKYFGSKMKAAIGEKPGIPIKPEPSMVNSAISEMNASKERAIYIGDSEVDIFTAKNAGIPSVSVLWGFRDRSFLKERGAEVFVETTKELLDVLLEFKKEG